MRTLPYPWVIATLALTGCVATSQELLEAERRRLEEQIAVTPEAMLVRLQGVLQLIPPQWAASADAPEIASWEVLPFELPPEDDPDLPLLPEDAPDFLMAVLAEGPVVYGVAVIDDLPAEVWPVLRWDRLGVTVVAGNLRDFLADELRALARDDDRRHAAQEAWLRLRLGLHFPELLDERLAAARETWRHLEVPADPVIDDQDPTRTVPSR